MTTTTFVEQCLEGVVDADAIDNFVARWHAGEGGESLPKFLGFSEEEYALWVERPGFLPAILSAKKHGVGLREAALEGDNALSPDQADEVLAWLHRTKRA